MWNSFHIYNSLTVKTKSYVHWDSWLQAMKAFIVASESLENTIRDFWKMIVDKDSVQHYVTFCGMNDLARTPFKCTMFVSCKRETMPVCVMTNRSTHEQKLLFLSEDGTGLVSVSENWALITIHSDHYRPAAVCWLYHPPTATAVSIHYLKLCLKTSFTSAIILVCQTCNSWS